MAEKLNNNITKEFQTLFRNKEYKQALIFLKEHRNDFDAGVLSFNEGTILFKQENFLQARLKFEKAHKLGFTSNETIIALEKTKEILGVASLEVSSTRIEQIEHELSTTSLDFFITVSLVLILLSFVKKLNVFVRISLFILAFAPVGYYYAVVDKYSQKVALENKSVYLGPSNMFEEVQLLPKGMIFITKETLEGWTKISFPASHSGWVKNSDMENL